VKQTFKEKIAAKLQALGVRTRQANELAEGLKATTRPIKTRISVRERVEKRLITLGVSERKAKELAKSIAPTVSAALKTKQQKSKVTIKDTDTIIKGAIDATDDAELDKVAPRINGVRLRIDRPTVTYRGEKGLELLRVMHGLTSQNTYLVAAVKGEEGIVAARKFGEDSYKLKFYPNYAFWNFTQSQIESIGGYDYLNRGPYERHMYTRDKAEQVLLRIEAEAKPKSKIKELATRMLSINMRTLQKAFSVLHEKVKVTEYSGYASTRY